MREYKILLIDDDDDQEIQLRQTIEDINEDEEVPYSVSCEVARTIDSATYYLYTNKFDGLIVDLTLNEGDEVETDEILSGNVLLNQILRKELIPVVVRTGTPDRFVNIFEKKDNIIKIYPKDETDFYTHISELVEMKESSFFKIFGTDGKISSSINQLFWQVIPDCFSSWDDQLMLSMPDKEETIVRYISSWVINKYNYSGNSYNTQDPLEMYMFPNTIEQICTGDIFEKNGNYYIVLTPACDLANHKTENILLAKIVSHNQIKDFSDRVDKVKNAKDEQQFESKLKSAAKWFRNGEQPRYHFLPKVSFFEGGFVDFQQIISVEYYPNERSLSDQTYIKLGVLTDSFVKDVVSRFGIYYQRQGQPEFNSSRVIEYLLDETK